MTPAGTQRAATVIVGGSVAGIGVADELRRLGYDGAVTVIDAQDHLPYDRPPLSKGVLTRATSPVELSFHDADHYREADITLRLGTRVCALDAAARAVELESGERLTADAVVIASGARARRLPGAAPGIHVIREQDDALALREALSQRSRIAIIGGGFIGAEVASSARSLGLDTTIVELASRPFEAIVGPHIAERLLALHEAAGIRVRCGVAVSEVAEHDGEQSLRLSDGGTLSADITVAGLGAKPETQWLADSELMIEDGVICDARGWTSVAGIYAAGDVARWPTPRDGSSRHEHWTSAREQGRVVAHAIAGVDGPEWAAMIPYVWSDQHGKRIQILGKPAGADTVELVHEAESGAFLALYGRDGRLVGAVGCNQAGATTRQRRNLSQPTSFTAAVDAFAATRAAPLA